MFDIERKEHAAWLWLDRPDKLNALNSRFWEGLPGVMAELGTDPEVRVVVLAGRGRAFSVGIDLDEYGPKLARGELGGGGASPAAGRRNLLEAIKAMQAAISSVADCPKPVIAAVHGYCLGAGVDLITAADIRLASADAVFAVRETPMAIVADVGTLQRLPRIIDPGAVADLVYTGRDVSAGEAGDLRLVSRVLEDAAALWRAAGEMAAAIAANSPLVVQGVKRVLRATADATVGEGLDYVALWNAAFLESEDLGEAMAAFGEQRPPEFRGR